MSDPLAGALRGLDPAPLRAAFVAQGKFAYAPALLPAPVLAPLVAAVAAVGGHVNRNYLPGHKQGGSVSRHALDQLAPAIGALYRSSELIGWLSALAGEPLQLAPREDPHGYALYFYTEPGDHIGWHYDTSYYAGRRYTVLIGLIDESSCRLDYQLHTRSRGRDPVAGSLRLEPGGLVFFDGDALRHRISPLAANERRVSLTFEYVTDPHMHGWWRFVSNMKDSLAYFGFRQVFGGRSTRARDGAR